MNAEAVMTKINDWLNGNNHNQTEISPEMTKRREKMRSLLKTENVATTKPLSKGFNRPEPIKMPEVSTSTLPGETDAVIRANEPFRLREIVAQKKAGKITLEEAHSQARSAGRQNQG